MNRLRWIYDRARALLGWQGLAGGALLFGGLILSLAGVAPLERELEDIGTPLSYSDRTQRPAAASEQSSAEQLSLFYEFFNSEAPLTEWLARLDHVAAATGITLRQGEYHLVEERTTRLKQYQVTLPVTATYPQIKLFVRSVLREMPIVSLDQVSLQRRRISDAAGEAQIQFTIYLFQG